jgi:signal peptidase II
MADIRSKAYGVAAGVFVLDRLTKWVIETRLSFVDTYRVIPGFFDIVRSENRGVAFSLFDQSTSSWRTPALVIASLAAVVLLIGMLWKSKTLDRNSVWGFALILGGAAGNVFDRIVWGHVTDFLLLYVGQYSWPTFNVADSAIVAGSGLLLLDMFKAKRQATHVS